MINVQRMELHVARLYSVANGIAWYTCLNLANLNLATLEKITKLPNYNRVCILTTEFEQVSKEEAGLVEGLKFREGALLEVSPQRLPTSLLREQRLQHGPHHIKLGAGHSYTPTMRKREREREKSK